jgi:tetratricopeptide (TPR) repeat protein
MPFHLHIIHHEKDEKLLRLFESFLKVYKHDNILETWHSGLLIGGLDIKQTIEQQLHKADGIVVLCSINLLADDATYEQLEQALSLHHETNKMLVAVLLKPCNWKDSIIKNIPMVLPKNKQPIIGISKRNLEYGFLQVTEDLLHVIQQQKPSPEIQEAIENLDNVKTTISMKLSVYSIYKGFFTKNLKYTQALFALGYPSSLSFLEQLIDKQYIKTLKQAEILKEEEETCQLEFFLSEYFSKDFIIDDDHLKDLAEKSIYLLKTNQYKAVDLLNIIHLLITLYDKKPAVSLEDEIITAFLTIKFRTINDPHSIIKTLNIFGRYIDKFSVSPQQKVAAINNYVSGLDTIGLYENALLYSIKNLKYSQEYLGDLHPETANGYEILANVYYEMGDFNKSISAYQKALKIIKQINDANDIKLAILYQNIARPYSQLGGINLQQVVQLYQKALEICHKQVNTNEQIERLTSNILGNLSVTYENMGLYEQALKYQHEAIMTKEKILGKQHHLIAINYNNLANVYLRLGKNQLALEYAQKAINIRSEKLGKDHPFTLVSEQNLASIYIQIKSFDKAQIILERLISVYSKNNNHKDYFAVTDEYANLFLIKKEYDKALEWFEKTLPERQKIYGESHVGNAYYALNLGKVYYKKKEYDIALEKYEEALIVLAYNLGNDHPDIAHVLFLKAKIFLKKQAYNEALKCLSRALDINLQKLGSQHVSVANIYKRKAQIYLIHHLYPEAIDNNQKALSIYLTIKDQVNTAQTLAYLLDTCLKMPNPKSSNPCEYLNTLMLIKDKSAYLCAIEILKKLQSFNKIDLNILNDKKECKNYLQKLLADLDLQP